MNVELFPFQKTALGNYHSTNTPQVVSDTAPAGAGRTIVMSAPIETICFAANADCMDALNEYARQNPGVGRIQLIRIQRDSVGKERAFRLDMSRSFIRDKVSRCTSSEELNHIFDSDGFFQPGGAVHDL